MSPRTKVLAMLAINGILMAAISWRYVHVDAAWNAWNARKELRRHLKKGGKKR